MSFDQYVEEGLKLKAFSTLEQLPTLCKRWVQGLKDTVISKIALNKVKSYHAKDNLTFDRVVTIARGPETGVAEEPEQKSETDRILEGMKDLLLAFTGAVTAARPRQSSQYPYRNPQRAPQNPPASASATQRTGATAANYLRPNNTDIRPLGYKRAKGLGEAELPSRFKTLLREAAKGSSGGGRALLHT